MEIKELVGFVEPVTKLIEEFSKGIGHVYKPLGTVLNAKADACRIRELSESIKEHLIDGKNEVVITNEDFKVVLKGNSIETRAIETMVYKEIQNQINLENIVNKAVKFIENNSSISNESVDIDWMTRFINISQDISNEEMQNLWAKILANEVSKPNSYSLRTLEVLKSISHREAKLFSRFVDLSVRIQDQIVVMCDQEYLSSKNISVYDLNLLKELNLVNLSLGYTITSETSTHIIYNDKGLIIENNEKDCNLDIDVLPLTLIGKEINSLINKDYDIKNLFDFANYIEFKYTKTFGNSDNLKMYCGEIAEENDNLLRYKSKKEILFK